MPYLLLLLLLLLPITIHSCRRMLEDSRSLLLLSLLRAWRDSAVSARAKRLKGLLKLAENNASHVSQKLLVALASMQWRENARASKLKRANAIEYLNQQQLPVVSPSSSMLSETTAAASTASSIEVLRSRHMMALREFSVTQALAKGSMRKVRVQLFVILTPMITTL
jgi:hypothetical protein